MCFVLVATSVATNLVLWLVWMNGWTFAQDAGWMSPFHQMYRSRKQNGWMSTSALILVRWAQTLQSWEATTLRICHHLLESGIQPHRWLTLPALPVVQEKEVSCTNEWGIQHLNLAPFWVIQPKLSLRKPQWVAEMYTKASKASFIFSCSTANLRIFSYWRGVTCLWLTSCHDSSCK